jgi:hypothetical protein
MERPPAGMDELVEHWTVLASVADAEKLTGWLAANVAHAERDADRVRVELLKPSSAAPVPGRPG